MMLVVVRLNMTSVIIMTMILVGVTRDVELFFL